MCRAPLPYAEPQHGQPRSSDHQCGPCCPSATQRGALSSSRSRGSSVVWNAPSSTSNHHPRELPFNPSLGLDWNLVEAQAGPLFAADRKPPLEKEGPSAGQPPGARQAPPIGPVALTALMAARPRPFSGHGRIASLKRDLLNAVLMGGDCRNRVFVKLQRDSVPSGPRHDHGQGPNS